jgi:predicted DCC family thiol-disulfide oxidoreductase YuxK
MSAISTEPCRLTVLYDAGCPLCTRFRDWLLAKPTLVPLALVPAGSHAARIMFPGLDHAATLQEITVVADTGAVWTGEAAWVLCLWATVEHRGHAEQLARPAWLPVARAAALAAAGLRAVLPRSDYADCRDGTCQPSLAQG